MDAEEFLKEILTPVQEFCRSLDANPPAYSYVPLRTDQERIRVMQSRLFNELRAADLFGGWLKTTPEFDVKTTLADSAHEEMQARAEKAGVRRGAARPERIPFAEYRVHDPEGNGIDISQKGWRV